jgi:hypothetical protein
MEKAAVTKNDGMRPQSIDLAMVSSIAGVSD